MSKYCKERKSVEQTKELKVYSIQIMEEQNLENILVHVVREWNESDYGMIKFNWAMTRIRNAMDT